MSILSFIKELFMNQEERDYLQRQRLYCMCLELNTWFTEGDSPLSTSRQVKVLKQAVKLVSYFCNEKRIPKLNYEPRYYQVYLYWTRAYHAMKWADSRVEAAINANAIEQRKYMNQFNRAYATVVSYVEKGSELFLQINKERLDKQKQANL